MLADEDTSYLDAVSAPDPPSGIPQEKAKERVCPNLAQVVVVVCSGPKLSWAGSKACWGWVVQIPTLVKFL